MTNAITFFEISGPDRESLRRFCREGLDLDVAPVDNDYAGIAPREGAVAGGLWDGTATFGQYAIPYVEVPDVKAAVEQATAAGATVVVPPTTHGPTLTAHITDPAGNRIGLFHMLETPGGAAGCWRPPAERPAEPAPWRRSRLPGVASSRGSGRPRSLPGRSGRLHGDVQGRTGGTRTLRTRRRPRRGRRGRAAAASARRARPGMARAPP